MEDVHRESLRRIEVSTPLLYAIKKETSDQFCTSQNIEQCLAYLSKELSILGFTPFHQPEAANSCDLVALLNATYHLYQENLKNLRNKDELEKKSLRLYSDLDQSYATISRLKESQEHLERTVASLKESERQLKLKLNQLQIQLKTEKNENKRQASALSQQQAQYHHELRKRERELSQVKEWLSQSKMMDKRFGLEALNTLPRKDGHRTKWKNNSSNLTTSYEDLYKAVLTSHEARENLLLEENLSLKDCLTFLQEEFSNLLSGSLPILDCNDNKISIKSPSLSKTSAVPDPLPDGFLQLPFSMAGKKIEDRLREVVFYIKKYVATLQESLEETRKESSPSLDATKLQEEVDILRKKLDETDQIIEHQQNLIESLTTVDPNSSFSELKESFHVEEFERLQQQKQLFLEQKLNFEKERKAFTEAAIRLAREKREFEEQKREFHQSRFFSLRTPRHQKNGLDKEPPLLSSSSVFTSPDGNCRHLVVDSPECAHFFRLMGVERKSATLLSSLSKQESFSLPLDVDDDDAFSPES